ncbi:hypothetical protein MMC26_001996 [Xylographa opegraphella]|nr:hypothetical protein [Xylographa opegraphella]
MATYNQVTCSTLYSNSSLPLQTNPDIAGIGVSTRMMPSEKYSDVCNQVIISFVFTAYFTFILIFVHYVLDCSQEADRNPIDRGITKFLRICIRLDISNWGPSIVKGVLMYSDQQLVTGIAILSAGYSQLSGGLPVYYRQFLLQLAWFSSLTHLTTLTLLRQYFWQNAASRRWRITLMIVLAVMQTVALLPTIYDSFGPNLPAICVLTFVPTNFGHPVVTTDSVLTLAIFLTYLISSYVTRLVELSRITSAFFGKWLRLKPGNQLKGFLELLQCRIQDTSAKLLWWSLHTTFFIIFVFLRALFDIAESTLWEYSNLFFNIYR